ncbi:MAG: STAS domain-containing protein [Chitinivibrionales bacterium]|nr:STAS domain-containing protein [Chitinivibrionales bacterium]
MALELHERKYKDIPLLELVGRVVDIDVKKFSRKLESIYKKDPKAIIIDVTRTNFMDSHGLGIIVYYHTRMQSENKKVIVLNANTNPRSYINRLFELTNLNQVLNVVRNLK